MPNDCNCSCFQKCNVTDQKNAFSFCLDSARADRQVLGRGKGIELKEKGVEDMIWARRMKERWGSNEGSCMMEGRRDMYSNLCIIIW